MNNKTILSSTFPELFYKWKKYVRHFHNVKKWIIASDYCLDDKEKPNNVLTFTICPYDDIEIIQNGIKQFLPADIKNVKDISDKAINYLKDFPYFFSIAIVLNDKNKFLDLQNMKLTVDNLIRYVKLQNEEVRKSYLSKLNTFRGYLNRKNVDIKTLIDVSMAVKFVSIIIEFLMIKARATHVLWVSDRDRITKFQDGIAYTLVNIQYVNLIKKRVPELKILGVVAENLEHQFAFEEIIRIPDYNLLNVEVL